MMKEHNMGIPNSVSSASSCGGAQQRPRPSSNDLLSSSHSHSSYNRNHNLNVGDGVRTRDKDPSSYQSALTSTKNINHSDTCHNLDMEYNDGTETHRMTIARSNSSLLFTRVISLFSSFFPGSPSSYSRYTLISPLRLLSKLLLLLTIIIRVFFLHPLHLFLNMLFSPRTFDGPYSADPAAKDFCRYVCNIWGKPSGDEEEESESFESVCPFVDHGYNKLISNLTSLHVNNDNNTEDTIPPLVLVYLHSPLHSDSVPFLRDTLGHCMLRPLLSDSSIVKCWGASIHAAEGRRIAHAFRVYGYPFLWMGRVMNNTMETFFRLEGRSLSTTSYQLLHMHLEMTIRRYRLINTEQATRDIRQREQQALRTEQDREYQEALEEDRRKDRMRVEEERRVHDDILMKQRVLEKELQNKKKSLEWARMFVGDEPDARDNDVAMIRFTLPSGLRINRNFRGSQTVRSLRAFLMLYWDGHGNNHDIRMKTIANFDLLCNFPKKSLKGKDERTLREEGLFPKAVIMVQDMDS